MRHSIPRRTVLKSLFAAAAVGVGVSGCGGGGGSDASANATPHPTPAPGPSPAPGPGRRRLRAESNSRSGPTPTPTRACRQPVLRGMDGGIAGRHGHPARRAGGLGPDLQQPDRPAGDAALTGRRYAARESVEPVRQVAHHLLGRARGPDGEHHGHRSGQRSCRDVWRPVVGHARRRRRALQRSGGPAGARHGEHCREPVFRRRHRHADIQSGADANRIRGRGRPAVVGVDHRHCRSVHAIHRTGRRRDIEHAADQRRRRIRRLHDARLRVDAGCPEALSGRARCAPESRRLRPHRRGECRHLRQSLDLRLRRAEWHRAASIATS